MKCGETISREPKYLRKEASTNFPWALEVLSRSNGLHPCGYGASYIYQPTETMIATGRGAGKDDADSKRVEY
jgi:hypothetical protein